MQIKEWISSPEVDLADFRMFFVHSGFFESLVLRLFLGNGEKNTQPKVLVIAVVCFERRIRGKFIKFGRFATEKSFKVCAAAFFFMPL